MRAVLCKELGPVENLVFEPNWPDPVPGKGEVVVDVKSGSVNFPDVLMIQGKYQFSAEPPFVPGSELAGVISAVGEGVSGYAVGDRVIARSGTGAFGEKAKAKVEQLTKVPEGVDFDTAATFMVTYGTTHHALIDRAQLKPGETLLVLGAAGGTGFAAIQVGKYLGLRVIASASSEQKKAAALAGGADAVVTTGAEDWRDQVKAANNGKPIDLVFDGVGGDATDLAFRTLGYDGRHLVIGFPAGIAALKTNLPLLKSASLVGVQVRGTGIDRPELLEACRATVQDMVAKGLVSPAIAARYPIEDYATAMNEAFAGKAAGRIVLVMGD